MKKLNAKPEEIPIREETEEEKVDRIRTELMQREIEPLKRKMQTALVAIEKPATQQLPTVTYPTPEQVAEWLVPGIDLPTAHLFVHTAKSYGLDPWRREIFLVPFWDDEKKKKTWTSMVSYLVYIDRARRDPDYKFFQCGLKYDEANKVTGAWCKIFKHSWGEMPFYYEIDADEYIKRHSQTGKPMGLWASKPKTMLKKVAICQAHRLVYPKELGGLPDVTYEIEDEAGVTAEEAKRIEEKRNNDKKEQAKRREPDDQFFDGKPEKAKTGEAVSFQINHIQKLLEHENCDKELAARLKIDPAVIDSAMADLVKHANAKKEGKKGMSATTASKWVKDLSDFIQVVSEAREEAELGNNNEPTLI